jgi:hypothetical protein
MRDRFRKRIAACIRRLITAGFGFCSGYRRGGFTARSRLEKSQQHRESLSAIRYPRNARSIVGRGQCTACQSSINDTR